MKRNILFALIIFLFLQKAFPQVARFSIEGNSCVNSELNFIDETAITTESWLWDFGDGNSSTQQNPNYSYTDSGSYIVQLTVTSNGNSYNNNQEIYISENPRAYFTTDTSQVYYSSYSRVFIDTSSSENTIALYIWDFGDNSSTVNTDVNSTLYKYADNGDYIIKHKIIDNAGCVDSISKTITIVDRYFVPNVFTPNNDFVNDNFVVTSNGNTLFSIEIYSRWGNLVFQRNGHQQIVWDGRMPDGSLVSPGTYYYVINSESGNVTYDPEKGFITVFY